MTPGPHVERPRRRPPRDAGHQGGLRGKLLSGRRGKVLSVVGTVVLGLGIYLLIGRIVNFTKLLDELRKANAWWFVPAALGEALSYIAYTFIYRPIASERGGPRPGFLISLRITVAGFGAFVLGSAAGNLAVDYWALRRMGQKPSEATAQVLALNTAEWAVLALMAAVAAIAMLAGMGRGAPRWLELTWALAFVACLPGAVFVSSPKRRHLAVATGGRIRRAVAAGIRSVVVLRAVINDRRACLEVLLGGLAFWAAKLLTTWAALRAFGVSLNVAPLTLAYATGYAATTLPLPAGGAGGVDAARTYGMRLVGVPLGPAVLGTFAARVFSFWLPILPAALATRSLKRLATDLPRVPHAPAGPSAGQPAAS